MSTRDGVKELREALIEVMVWIKNWDVPFLEDDEWPATQAKVDAALLAKAEAPASQRLSEDERREYYCKGWNTLAEMIRAHFPEFDDKNILKWADDVNMVRIACDDWRERAEAAESAILAEPAPPAPEASSQKTCASADCKEPREIGLSFCKKHSLNYNIWLVQRVEKGASV